MKRGRNQRRRPSNNINRAMDSNGPEVRIRGTANQIYDKYLTLARDAQSAGDRIKAESYLQHAEHYFRVIRSIQATQQAQQPQAQTPPPDGDGEQPDIAEVDAGQPNQGRQRRNQPAKDAEKAPAEPAAETTTSTEEEPPAEEPKKPRRRRTRKAAPKSEAADAAANDEKSKEPQAAE